jgi:hypothetical protein
MKTRRTVWANGFLFAALVAATAVGCGSDDDDDGSGGSGGTAGKGGSAGTGKGGTSGKGGASGAGTGGTAGKGGSAGSGGKGGSSGSGGSAGTSGEGSGGDAGGEAGASGTAGSGGSSGDGGGSGGTDAGGAGATGDGGTEAGGTGGDAAGAGGVSGGEGGVGGEPAVTACELYCDVMMATCGDSGANAQYPDEAQCLATCAVFPEGTTGNSLGCRATHAALAATQGADPHCDHAGPAGVGMCGSNCEGYCSLMMNVCDGTFASNEACMTACGTVPENTFTNFVYPAPAGNTLACRIAHATNAAASAGAARTNHCTHAAGAAPCN